MVFFPGIMRDINSDKLFSVCYYYNNRYSTYDLNQIIDLIKNGEANVNFQNSFGNTSFHFVC